MKAKAITLYHLSQLAITACGVCGRTHHRIYQRDACPEIGVGLDLVH